jgi:hypothetical protein
VNIPVQHEKPATVQDKPKTTKSNLTPAKTPSKKAKAGKAPEQPHQPTLSKVSMVIASTLGDPFERLTSKSKSIRKKTKPVDQDSLTFTPKINSKSTILAQNKKDRGANRFQELHEQAYYLESKKEKLRIEKELAMTAQETQDCAFKPHLISNYSPEYLNEMNFVERSYLWKKRIEQKLDNQRKIKSEAEPAPENGVPTFPSKGFQSRVMALPLQVKPLTSGKATAEELNEFFNLLDDPCMNDQTVHDRFED